MNIGILTFGIFVTILLIAGFLFTISEFKKMGETPDDYRNKELYKNKEWEHFDVLLLRRFGVIFGIYVPLRYIRYCGTSFTSVLNTITVN